MVAGAAIQDAFGFAASVASLTLAVVAIWLSIRFFELAGASSEQIKQAARDIDLSVKRLEGIFEKMYADTLGMFRDAYADIREHAWPAGVGETEGVDVVVESKVEERLAHLQADLDERLASVMAQLGNVDERLSQSVHEILRSAITESRSAETEAREETLRDAILWRLRNRKAFLADDFVSEMMKRGFPGRQVVLEIERLRDEGLVSWTLPGEPLAPETSVDVSVEARRIGQRLHEDLLARYKNPTVQ